jgi:hypothetical protein
VEYFASSHGFVLSQENMESMLICELAEKKRKLRREIRYLDTGIRPNRYKESARTQGQEDLDTNRGAAGQKTGRERLPTQGKGQRGYSHHA